MAVEYDMQGNAVTISAVGLGTPRDTPTASNDINETDCAGAQHHSEWSTHGQVSG